MRRHKITLDNAKINALAVSPEVTALFPFFTKSVSTSNCCGKKSSKPDYESIRTSIIMLTPSDKTKLREILKADIVRVYVKRDGVVKEVEI